MRADAARSPAVTPTRARVVIAALAIACCLSLVLATRAQAQGACVTRLPVSVSLPDGPYAAAYTQRIRLRVDPRGRRIRNLRAELYTFGGQRLAVSERRRAARGAVTLGLVLQRSYRPLQVGAFTLMLTGEPNASRSCGPKHTTRVLRMRPCSTTLPLAFPALPSGSASDYGGYLSVAVRTRGPVIRGLRSSVFGFDGTLLGSSPSLTALFGERTLDHELVRPLAPGDYTVIVEGAIGGQPASCGRKTAQATMTFG
ncbi:MAG: hypothetical protein Q8O56_00870 [Solirubrobacteraceae bacterium]|nr:hypothetical protein [Solirubrobacteraceae bacterium]